MHRLRPRFVLPAIVACIAISSVWAASFMCSDPVCPATKVVNGIAKVTLFSRGDVVHTEDGWIVSSAHGWVEM
jgi:hypothetical protein